MKRRVYNSSDINMLMACNVMADHALENVAVLQGGNSAWNEAFFNEIKERIQTLLKDVFGIKSVKILQDATAELVALQSELLPHLTMLRKQILTAWRDDKTGCKEILDSLGYSIYWNKANTCKSQTALIAMLEIFEKGCTPALLDKFTSKKISDVSIDFVRNNFRRMFDLNVIQEKIKSSRKLITSDVIEQFNAVYNNTMFYSGSAQTLFKNDSIRRGQFTYSQVVKRLGGGNTSGKSADDNADDASE